MKYIISLLCLIPSIALSQPEPDKAEINGLIDQLVSSWNTHDFSTMRNNSTPDLNWVNIVGIWWKDRETAVGAHYGIFNTMFNGVKFEKKSVALRAITNDVVIANLLIHVGEFYPPDGVDHGNNKREAADDILTLVYVKKGGKWLLTAAQNTVVDAIANREP